MDPTLTTRGPFTVLGVASCVTRGEETPELFAGIWQDFEARRAEIEPIATARRYFGVSFPTADPTVTEYIAGMMVRSDAPVPQGLSSRTIVGGGFAVFECPLAAIGPTYRRAFMEWLPRAPVELDPVRPAFEEYPERASDEPVRLHIPVQNRAARGDLP